jgi:MFS superfamily sulfate permease-like transporter
LDGALPAFHLPTTPAQGWSYAIIFEYGAIMAVIGIIESLMALHAMNQLTRSAQELGPYHQECVAQGTGNLVSALFGSVGGCTMIGQTVVMTSGARGRLSGVSASLFILLIFSFASPAINLIPITCLTGILFVVVMRTFEWATFAALPRIPLTDAATIVGVSVLAVVVDLAVAVAVGTAFLALVHAWKEARTLQVALPPGRADKVNTASTPLCDGEGLSRAAAEPRARAELLAAAGGSTDDAQDGDAAAALKPASRRQLVAASAGADVVHAPGQRHGSTSGMPGAAGRPGELTRGAAATEEQVAVSVRASGDGLRASGGAEGDAAAGDVAPATATLLVRGPLTFATAWEFSILVAQAMDTPAQVVVLDMAASKIEDYSALHALYTAVKAYRKAGKALRLCNVDAASMAVLHRAGRLINKGNTIVLASQPAIEALDETRQALWGTTVAAAARDVDAEGEGQDDGEGEGEVVDGVGGGERPVFT